jgi:hypothetical protein
MEGVDGSVGWWTMSGYYIREIIFGLAIANYCIFRDAQTRLVGVNFKIDDGDRHDEWIRCWLVEKGGRRALRINSGGK